MRRFASLATPPAFAARHRAFAARLAGRSAGSARAPGLALVLRRACVRVARRVWMPLHFALQILQRAAAPWAVPHPVLAMAPGDPAPGAVRERTLVTERVVERSGRELHARPLALRVVHVPGPAAAGTRAALAPNRVVPVPRIERPAGLPRVAQVVVRAAGPAAARAEAARLDTPVLREVRTAPRAATPVVAPTPALPLPPAELSRVTDHVIEQLDRRVLSYRERMGL